MNWKYAGPLVVLVVAFMAAVIGRAFNDDELRLTGLARSHADAWAKDMGASKVSCVPPEGCGTYNTYCDVVMPDGRIIALSCNTRGCHATGTVPK